jgi:hypothetical protein
MHILDVLHEDAGTALAYRQLSPLQVGILKKIGSGQFNPDAASQQAQEAADGLIDLGLIDSISFDITPKGKAALDLAVKYGSADRRNLANAKQRQQEMPGQVQPDAPFEID